MERKDTPLLQKISAIAKINEEIIERIKNKTTDIIICYQYTFSTKNNNWQELEITERKITKSDSSILDSWCPIKELNKINDFFNDNLDYTCNNFSDIIRLNKEMVRIAHKYVIFDCTETAIGVIRSFLENMEILQTFLGEIEISFQDTPSKLKELTTQVNGLNKAINGVATLVVDVNKDQQKIQQNDKEKEQTQKKLQTERIRVMELLKRYPGCTLEQAEGKEKIEGSLIFQHRTIILSWLAPKKELDLIYKGSCDGFKAQNFHQKCDNKGETLTVIKSTKGYLFGGYTPITWTSRGNYAWDQRTFIFTLTNPNNISPTKYSNSGPSHGNTYSIYDVNGCGPTFGGGYDINVYDQCNQNQNNNIGFPYSFADTTGFGYNTFTGSANFQVAEIEVYLVK